MTRVVNRKETQVYDVYVGRPSPWGNPYKIGQIVDGRRLTRADVLAYYERWLLSQPTLLAKLPELRGKVLACWCAPLPCHGNILARLADAIEQEAVITTATSGRIAVTA